MYFFDQYSDPENKTMKKLANAGVVVDLDDVAHLQDKDFAVVIMGEKRAHRQFPLHTKEATALSTAYFLENRERMGPTLEKIVGARIKEACAKHGLKDLGVLKGYSLGLDPGQSHFVSHETIQREIEPLEKEASATESTVAADPAPVELNPNIVEDMAFRVRNLEPDQQYNYVKVAEAAASGQITPEEAQAVVSHLDAQYGINEYKYRTTPEQVITKQASAAPVDEIWDALWGIEKVASATDKINEVLASERRDDFIKELEAQFGERMARDFVENPAVIYDSLPKPHQEIISELSERFL